MRIPPIELELELELVVEPPDRPSAGARRRRRRRLDRSARAAPPEGGRGGERSSPPLPPSSRAQMSLPPRRAPNPQPASLPTCRHPSLRRCDDCPPPG